MIRNRILLAIAVSMIFFVTFTGGGSCDVRVGVDDDDDVTDDDTASTPARPSGPTTTEIDVSTQYRSAISECDDDEDAGFYRFDFGDGTITDFAESRTATHTYDSIGTFEVRTQARCDGSSSSSDWSDALEVEVVLDNLSGDWHSAWLNQTSNVLWVAGSGGRILEYDISSQKRTVHQVTSTQIDFTGVFGNSKEIFFTADDGKVICYSKGKFSAVEMPVHTSWAKISGKDGVIYAIGKNGLIAKNQNGVWQHLPTPTTQNLNDLWVLNAESLFVAGNSGTIMFFDGISWNVHSTPTNKNLNAVSGTSFQSVWAVGEKGTVLHFNGDHWNNFNSSIEIDLWDVQIDSEQILIAGDKGFIAHGNGTSWLPVAREDDRKVWEILLHPVERKAFAIGSKKLFHSWIPGQSKK